MAAQHTQIETNKHEFRWSFRKKGKDVLKLCRQMTVVVTLAGGIVVMSAPANANPSGGNVTAGAATITSSGTTTTINQTSHRAIIEWDNFDIAAGETTQFIQPSTSSLALNRVVNSNQATAINGNLTANGRVLVINPNGVLIGPSGNVDVSGFVASTADIDNTRFMTASGAMEFDRAGKIDATVENQGRITIRDAGLGVLVAPVVRNSGVIEGNMAKLQLGAGDTFGVDMYGDGLLHLAVGETGGARTIKAENSGTIVANAGKVVMTAAAANNVVNSVINTSGVIEAKGLVAKGGEIILTGAGASVKVAGKVDASGKTGGGSVKIGGDVKGANTLAKAKTVDVATGSEISANAGTSGDGGTIAVWSDVLTTSRGRFSATGGSESGNGGFVETSSKDVLDFAGTFVDTSAAFGAYGLWLLDPTFTSINAGNIASINSATSNVLIDANDISVDTDVNIANAGISLKLDAKNNLTINDKTITLNGGDFSAYAKNITSNRAKIYSNGGDVIFDTNGNGKVELNEAVVVTKGGLFSMHSNNALILNQSNVSTGGGAFVADANGSITMNEDKIQTSGGDFTVAARGAVSMTGINVNTSGGTHTPSTTFSMNNSAAHNSFAQLFPNASNSLTKDGTNAGNVTITANGAVSGDRVCVTAGGSGCGFTLAPSTINLAIRGNDVYKTYGSVDPALTYTVSSGALMSGDSFTGALVRAAGNNVGTYAINQGTLGVVTSGGYTYVITYTPGTFTINAALLTITALDQGKTYGDTLDLGTAGFTTSGLVAGDSVTGVSLNSAGAAGTANVGTYDIAASNATGTGLSNYTITYQDGTLTVGKAALTIAANNQTKVYGDAMNYNNGGPYTVTGLKNSDTVDTTNGQIMGGWLPQHDVGTYNINIYGATGQGLSNYNITFVNGQLTVTKAPLTVTSASHTKTYGQQLTSSNLPSPSATFTGLKNGDTVTSWNTNYDGGYLQAPIGTYDVWSYVNEIVKVDGVTASLSNYDITYIKGVQTVVPASLTIIANNQTKTYGDALDLGTSAFTANGLKSWDSITGVSLNSAGAPATANAGNHAISGSGATGTGLGNYTINYVNGNLLVNKAALTVTANNRTKTYGDTLALGNTGFTASGLKNSDTVSTVTLNSSGRTASANVGNYNITASNAAGVGLGNYTITYVNGTLVVNPATLTITARDQAKVYGDSKNVDSAFLPFSVSGLKNWDFVTDVNLTSAGGAATANVGGYDIVANGASGWGLSNYNINYVNGTLTVTPALLLITADSFSKTYGNTHTFDSTDYGVYGLKNSDTVTGVTLTSNGAAATANVGLYGITGSNATGTGLSNYVIAYTPGLMLVNPAALTVTAKDQSKTYGASHNLGNTEFTVNGLKNSDTVDTVALSSAGAAATANAGSYAISANGAAGTGLSNYTITYVNGNLVVNKAALTVTANNQTKTYGENHNLGSAYTYSGLMAWDSINSVDLASAGAAVSANANAAGYDIVASNAAGSGLGNYNINYVDGKLVVNKADLYLAIHDQTKTFSNPFTFTGNEFSVVSGLVTANGDSVNNVPLASAGSAANAAVGSYAIVNTGPATGSGLGNYNVHYAPGTMTVNMLPAGTAPVIVLDALGRPIVSVANKAIVRDRAFEGYETRTTDVDVALRYRGNTPSTVGGNVAAVLASLEPAAGGDDVSAEDLANLEPAAGGDSTPAASNSDVDCANSFLDNQPCGFVQ